MSLSFTARTIELLERTPLHDLAAAADSIRREKHPARVVSFINDRNINYTNICVSRCRFCAFHRDESSNDSFLLGYEEIGRKIDEAKAVDAVQILLQGGLHPGLGLDWYTGLLRYIKSSHPIHVHGFSAPEIAHIAELEEVSVEKAVGALADAGLDSIPGGGAEVLCASVRNRVSPRKIGVRGWLAVHEAAHRLGLRTTATMVYGLGETARDLAVHLRHIHSLQEKTGGFTAFIPWSFQPANTMLEDIGGSTPARYLRVLAACRVMLDNIDSVQASWVTQGPAVAQLALYFGANDFGSTMFEENVVRAAGCSFKAMDERTIARLIREAGFEPVLRRQDYSVIRRL